MEDINPTSIVEPLKEMSTTDTKPSTENPNPTEESSTLKPSSVLESSTENPEKMEEELNPTSIVDPLKEMSITAAKPSTENPNPTEESSTLEPSSVAESSTENPAKVDDLNSPSVVEPLNELLITDAKPSLEKQDSAEESSVAESSTENPSPTDEASQETPEENFSFQVHPAIAEQVKELSITDAKPSIEKQDSAEESSVAESSTENPSPTDEASQETPEESFSFQVHPAIAEQVKELSITDVKPSTENPKPTEESSVAESWTENPSQIDEASQETPEESFSFQVYPAIKLKQALAALCVGWFNPEGLGLIEVDETGMELTVHSSVSGAVGHLWLRAPGLSNFMFSEVMIKKWVDVIQIDQILAAAADEDTITIRRLRASDQLVFSFGNAPASQFSAELFLRNDVKYEKFPQIKYGCEAVILRDQLEKMIGACEDPKNTPLIVADISVKGWDIAVGKYRFVCDVRQRQGEGQENGIRGVSGTQKHRAWFRWPDCEFLKKASVMAVGCLLCFTLDPPRKIMVRFNLRELGDLVYLNASQLTIFNIHERDDIKLRGPAELPKAAIFTEEPAPN